MTCDDVIAFWFEEIGSKLWWKTDKDVDKEIEQRFGDLLAAASRCDLYQWRRTAEGRLAEIIILDQFSRNIFRGSQASFANDPLALCLAQEAIGIGADQELTRQRRLFCYMPFMHSESRSIHEVALGLFTDLGLDSNLDFELKHKEIIDRFGRYPHRNAILGRQCTPEELEFLRQPGSSF